MIKVGKVTLDDSMYCGTDLYSDGKVEDLLLDIVSNHSRDEYDRIIEKEKKWPVLYHLSHIRENIVEWIPMSKTDSVLEIGSGCGAITGVLAKKAGKVTCIELSKKRSLINANKNSDCGNVEILLGNYTDIEANLQEKYDVITLIGVFEYAQGYMNSQSPYLDFLLSAKKHLKENGKLIIAIENKFGLKYWAGCVEDHKGIRFEGIEDYPETKGVRTFTRKGLEELFVQAGLDDYKFYYPYPDYKLPLAIYSDEYLPKEGELNNNFNNFDADRVSTFDESKVFDTIIREGEFAKFANSYLVVLTN